MKGFVPTPEELVDTMVAKLFRERPPSETDHLLDPGCGTGVFIQGVVRWCKRNATPLPRIIGIELDPGRFSEAERTLGSIREIELRRTDFLQESEERFDYIIGNPPYVSINGLSLEERTRYRKDYATARGRFDLYILFFEQALKVLKPNGRLVFVTPEKFLYVQTAETLRRRLSEVTVEEIDLIGESAFGDLVTYPTITTITANRGDRKTHVRLRDTTTRTIEIPTNGSSWLPQISGSETAASGPRLNEVFVRISCGVATGADSVYVVDDAALTPSLKDFAFPTISGRQLTVQGAVQTKQSMLIPYTTEGTLIAETELGSLGEYLRQPDHHARLMQRTCVARKPWYAFHENPPLSEILRPKILCKDIGQRPWFVVDETGEIVPRHSVYYLVPADPSQLHELCAYLNSPSATDWLMKHCQRAANGFVRVQSHILKKLPVPDQFLLQGELAAV
jgi:adenine-specific DNA-methyltransferase